MATPRPPRPQAVGGHAEVPEPNRGLLLARITETLPDSSVHPGSETAGLLGDGLGSRLVHPGSSIPAALFSSGVPSR